MKKLYLVMVALIVASMILAACGCPQLKRLSPLSPLQLKPATEAPATEAPTWLPQKPLRRPSRLVK